MSSGSITNSFNYSQIEYAFLNKAVEVVSSFEHCNQMKYAYIGELSILTQSMVNTSNIEVLEIGGVDDTDMDVLTASGINLLVSPQSDLADIKELAIMVDILEKLDWQFTPTKDWDYEAPIEIEYKVIYYYNKAYGASPYNVFNTDDTTIIRVISDTPFTTKSVIVGGQDLDNKRFEITATKRLRPDDTDMNGAVTYKKTFGFELQLQGADL